MMVPPFDETIARKECAALMETLDRERCLDFDVPPTKRDPALSTDYLWGAARGQMFGVLVCAAQEEAANNAGTALTGAETARQAGTSLAGGEPGLGTGGRYVVLKAFSSQYNSRWEVAGWVPPCFDAERYHETELRYDAEIHALTARIAELTANVRGEVGGAETGVALGTGGVTQAGTALAAAGATPQAGVAFGAGGALTDADTATQAETAPVAPAVEKACSPEEELARLKAKRRELSRRSLNKLVDLYRFTGANGAVFTLRNVGAGKSGDVEQFPAPVTAVRAARADNALRPQAAPLPSTGTGDCCAPKLLSYAYSHGLRPLSMAEFYYGAPNKSGTREHKQFYPPCDEKCGLVLPVLLGLKLVYRDEHLAVVEKPSGLLSVPGRGARNQDSVETRFRRLYPDCPAQPAVHRLDQDTSGLLVLACTKDAHRALQRQFEAGLVRKEYVALLSGPIVLTERGALGGTECAGDRGGRCGADWYFAPESSTHSASGVDYAEGQNTLLPVVNRVTRRNDRGDPLAGHLELPYRLDPENRPHQVFDPVHGKLGVTDWEIIGWRRGMPLVKFYPKTGRTHQLRIAAASPYGLGSPIQNDRLYGAEVPVRAVPASSAQQAATRAVPVPAKAATAIGAQQATQKAAPAATRAAPASATVPVVAKAVPARLALHASLISFTHPVTGEPLTFTSTPPSETFFQ